MQYKYKGIDKEGRRVAGTLSANSEEEAKAWLKQEGIYLQSLRARPESEKLKALFSRQMPMGQLSDFSRELSSYLGSGMTILTALKLMESQHRDEKRYAAFLGEVRRKVDEGNSLYKALAEQNVYQLPDFFLQSLRVAGESGKVSEVLTNMGQFFSLQSRIRKQVLNALAYPLFIFVVAIGMTGFLITFVVPKITGIFEDTGQQLPAITRFVLGLSDFFTHHYLALLLGLILFLVGWKLLYRLWDPFRYAMDALMLRLPVVGTLVQNHELARFSYILSLMLDSGVSYAQAVQLAGTTFGNEALKAKFEKATQKVVEGNKLSNALHLAGGVPLKRNFLQSLALGEESSEVASVMRNVSKLYSEENEDKIKILLSLMEPLMMLLIGGIVGVIVMAMLLPIFSMSLGAKI
ncbi:type II secretion system F family protein [Nitratifractor salsuginis]|uniref:General secretion pathway protein F n=1 Tax=Nitratifractor salsuginis (strain DSM 16511 / JCM 12458 / E9I37-1) TaxID=749222 RepID=E6WY94_NITSE|nr:type II secretion system F family protein [Nitratifractor salsuginis]ADV45342.1 Type II secretion system F domain protein [Nitratifractor salsuginis DSM 16511]